jgi:hypothetical protein
MAFQIHLNYQIDFLLSIGLWFNTVAFNILIFLDYPRAEVDVVVRPERPPLPLEGRPRIKSDASCVAGITISDSDALEMEKPELNLRLFFAKTDTEFPLPR